MAVNLSPVGGVAAQFLDISGNVLTGGKLLTYLAGTTTPAVTFTTSSGSIPQPNPIILNASGRVPGSGEIWLTDGISYKFVLTDSNDVLIATYDNITGINSNFVNFTSQTEIQIATAGQTVFNLTTMQYQPGTNNLLVFVDGVNQYEGSSYSFVETDEDTVTFVSGLHVGAEVKFTTATPINTTTASASDTAYTPPFVDSVTTNVQDKLSEIMSVKDFGAAGDGVTDDTTSIQNAIDSAISTGQKLYVPAGTYLVTDELVANGSLKIFGDGASSVLDCSTLLSGTTALTIQGSMSATTTTTSAYPSVNDRTISVSSSTGFADGDMIKITSTESFSTMDVNYLKGELGFVQTTASGTITLNSGLKDSYTSGTVTVAKVNPIENPIVADLKIIGPGDSEPNYGIRIDYAKHPVCSNVELIDFEDQAFAYSYCDSGSIANCKVQNCSGITNGVGYAFGLDLLTQFSHVTDCFASYVSCGFSTGGYYPVWNCVVDGNSFYGGNTTRPMIQTHINGANIVISNNTVSSGQIGIGVFARGNVITGNNVSNQAQYGIYLIEEGMVNGQIVGNKTQDCYRGIGVGSYTGSDATNVLIQSNQLMNCTVNGISCGVANSMIVNNIMSNVSPGILFTGPHTCTIENNEIFNITTVSQAYGVYLAPSAANAEFIYVKNNKIRDSDVPSDVVRCVIVTANCLNSYVTGNVFDMNITLANYIDNTGVGTVIGSNVIYKDLQHCATFASANVGVGTTTGFARTNANISYEINGRTQLFNSADNVWDLTGVSTTATEYLKVMLCLDLSQNPFIVEGVKATGAQTLARVPRNIPIDLCPIGIVEIPPSYAGGSLSGFVFHSVIGGQP
jgi:hypothetical protein